MATTNYSFNLPTVGGSADSWGTSLNTNWNSVDSLLGGDTPVSGIDINSGTIDGATIGASAAGAGTFTSLSADSLTGDAIQASHTDTTAGRVLTVGAFGLGETGAAAEVADIDDIDVASGFYSYNFNTTIGTQPGTDVHGTFMVLRREGNSLAQLAIPNGDDESVYVRRMRTDLWGDWSRVFTNQTILGTVSQSGGIPTGAVIESGTNANGEYVRFADGTQFCFYIGAFLTPAGQTLNAAGNIYRSDVGTWTFPAAYASPPVVTGYIESLDRWAVARPLGNSSCEFRQYSYQSSAAYFGIGLVAIGKWF